jgi:hypothetical protein
LLNEIASTLLELPTTTIFIALTVNVFGQHDHHDQTKSDTVSHDHNQMSHKDHGRKMEHNMDSAMIPMSHAFSLNLPMNRYGSGTGWLPDASPMYGYMLHSKKWMYMPASAGV